MVNSVINPDFIKPLESIFAPKEIITESNSDNPSFSDTLKNALGGVYALQEQTKIDSYNLAMGYTDDLESIMLNSSKATLALEVTTQLVSKAVNTYKEILQMQI